MFETNVENPNLYSPLTLAYAGDAVYELYIRTKLCLGKELPVSKLHKASTTYVKAKAQSDAVHAIMDKLNDNEVSVYKRGRNAKSQTVPKNADITDYRCATGFEALVGYLYLKGDNERLKEILDMSFQALNNIRQGETAN